MAKPAKCISVDQARQLQDNWISTRALEIERAQGNVDTREFFYTVDELQEYLDYVKELSKKQKIDNPGIRIYFAAYDDISDDKATVFLAPTEGATPSSNINYNIDPFNKSIGGWPPKSY
ncbi:hypothetical protein [uncultured Marixanthomonas sp.]|uniref:hypothetical protein n=1 Tax=uncultured Marixanthomonas sp. TaxID=757245 RepID=UPI0030DB85C6|tara:strand:- start:95938 stop:96294 length:357 start_codon:yes stop_codon:yes gene_type:complete